MQLQISLHGRFHVVFGVEHSRNFLQRVPRTRVFLDQVDLIVISGVALLAQVEDVILHGGGFGTKWIRLGDEV